jgi:hypothetical protein
MTGADLLAIRAAIILKQRGVERWHQAQTLKDAMHAHMEMTRAEQVIQRYGGVNSGIDEKSAAAQS